MLLSFRQCEKHKKRRGRQWEIFQQIIVELVLSSHQLILYIGL